MMINHLPSTILLALVAALCTLRTVDALATPCKNAVSGGFVGAVSHVSSCVGGNARSSALYSNNGANDNGNPSPGDPLFYAKNMGKKSGKIDPIAAASLSKEKYGIEKVQAGPSSGKVSQDSKYQVKPPSGPVPVDKLLSIPTAEDILKDTDSAMASINALLESIETRKTSKSSSANPKEPLETVRLESPVKPGAILATAKAASNAFKDVLTTAISKAKSFSEATKTESSKTSFPTDMQIKPVAKAQNSMQAFVNEALESKTETEPPPSSSAPVEFVKPADTTRAAVEIKGSQTPFPTDMRIKPVEAPPKAFTSETTSSASEESASPGEPILGDSTMPEAVIAEDGSSEVGETAPENVIAEAEADAAQEAEPVLSDAISEVEPAGMTIVGESPIDEEGKGNSDLTASEQGTFATEDQSVSVVASGDLETSREEVPSLRLGKSGLTPEEEEAQSKALAKFWELSAKSNALVEQEVYDSVVAEELAQSSNEPAVAKFWEISAKSSDASSVVEKIKLASSIDSDASATTTTEGATDPAAGGPTTSDIQATKLRPTPMTPEPKGFTSAPTVLSGRTQTNDRTAQSSRSWPPQPSNFFSPPVSAKTAMNKNKVPQSTRNMLHSTSNGFFTPPGMASIQSPRTGQTPVPGKEAASSPVEVEAPKDSADVIAEQPQAMPEQIDESTKTEKAGSSETPRKAVPPTSFDSLGSTFDERRKNLTRENNR